MNFPKIGFGTWRLSEGDESYNSVKNALRAGYRLIDTAKIYGNEKSVGAAIKDSKIPRSEIFLTTNSGLVTWATSPHFTLLVTACLA